MATAHDTRRNAYHHYHARAGNARVCAWTLVHAEDGDPEGGPPGLSSGISTEHARHEGFMREAALSIELLLKASICLRIDAGERTAPVPLSHNIPQLWTEAGLKRPADARTRHHLETLRVKLAWAGRYPTAASAEREASDLDALYADMEHRMIGSMKVYRTVPFRWDDFDKLFSLVEAKTAAHFEAHPTPS